MTRRVAFALGLVLLTACRYGGQQPHTVGAPSSTTSVDQCALPVDQRTGGWFCYDASPSPSPSATTQADDLMSFRSGDADDDGRFQTPSGNLRCVFASVDDTDWVTCDVARHSWPSPHCTSGQVVTVSLDTATGRTPQVDCGRPVGTGFRVLPYGHALTDMTLTCTSRRDGLECRSKVTHHGFVVSSTRYRVT